MDRKFTDGETVDEGKRDRSRYRHWWEHALRDIRQHSIVSWAQKVTNVYAQLHSGCNSLKARGDIQRQAMDAALYADGRFIGKWSTETAVEMARKSDEQCAELMRVVDQTAAAARIA